MNRINSTCWSRAKREERQPKGARAATRRRSAARAAAAILACRQVRSSKASSYPSIGRVMLTARYEVPSRIRRSSCRDAEAIVSGELDVFVTPLGRSVHAGDQAAAMNRRKSPSTIRMSGLRIVRGPRCRGRGAARRTRARVLLQKAFLGGGVGLDLAQVVLEYILARPRSSAARVGQLRSLGDVGAVTILTNEEAASGRAFAARCGGSCRTSSAGARRRTRSRAGLRTRPGARGLGLSARPPARPTATSRRRTP